MLMEQVLKLSDEFKYCAIQKYIQQQENKKIFVLDVDGVMTNGKFTITADCKFSKQFGPHDADGLKMINKDYNIFFITADTNGYQITYQRIVKQMGYPLIYLNQRQRTQFIINRVKYNNLVFMGDGIYDAKLLEYAEISFAPLNARPQAKKFAKHITEHAGGDGAVCDACVWLTLNK